MINSDFDETYFRFQNTVVTNEQQFFVTRDNRLVFTTPIQTGQGNKITGNQNYVVDQNINPENVNFIVDNITLFSTNPDVGNYLPLKIRLDDNIQVEFPKVDYSTLTDYKIIVDPPVNLNTISNHKYDKKNEYVVSNNAGVVEGNIVNSGGFAYILQESGEVSKFDLSTGGTLLTFPNIFNSIYANDNNVVGIEIAEIYNLSNGVPIRDYAPDGGNVKVLLVKDLIYTFYGNFSQNFDIWVKNGVIYDLQSLRANFFSVTSLIIAFAVYNDKFILGYTQDGALIYNLISGEEIFNIQLNPVIDNVEHLYFGGSDINRPLIHIVSVTSEEIIIHSIKDFNTIFTTPVITETVIKLVDGRDGQLVKRYLNTMYFVDNDKIYFFNLDNGVLYNIPSGSDTYGVSIINFNKDYSLSAGPTVVDSLAFTVRRNVRESDKVYTVTHSYAERSFSYNLSNNTFSFIISLPNNNQIKDLEIFKYVFDIRIRYTKKAKSLLAPATKMSAKEGEVDPNVPPVIGDMQQCEDDCDITCPEGKCKDEGDSKCPDGKCPPDEPTTRPSDFAGMTSAKDNPCKRKCIRGFGSAGRVLGYVDSDFSVVDFLNIYRTV